MFKDKIIQYENSQYATVKHCVQEYKKEKTWTEELIKVRTKNIAKILYDNIIEG